MNASRRHFVAAAAAAGIGPAAWAMGGMPNRALRPPEPASAAPRPHPYVGVWATTDGYVTQQLLANGRYDEARGIKESAFRGRYTISGDRIDYVDDSGLISSGRFRDGVLSSGGFLLFPKAK